MFWFVPRMYGPWTSTRFGVLDPSPALLLYYVFEWTVSYPSFVFPDYSTFVFASLLVSSSSYPIFTCFCREIRRFDWPRLSSSSHISCTGLYLVR